MSRLLYGNSDFFSLNPSGVPVVGQTLVTGTVIGMSGTGTPEGVVTAAPGSTWLQTDSTTDVKGWIKWVKASGTGNTGWIAGPEADTGWRTLTAISSGGVVTGAALDTGWGPVSGIAGYVKIRRVGNTVFLLARYLQATSSPPAGALLTPPTGFTGDAGYVLVATSGALRPVNQSVTAKVAYSTGVVSGDYVQGNASWLTPVAWPASLPGTA